LLVNRGEPRERAMTGIICGLEDLSALDSSGTDAGIGEDGRARREPDQRGISRRPFSGRNEGVTSGMVSGRGKTPLRRVGTPPTDFGDERGC